MQKFEWNTHLIISGVSVSMMMMMMSVDGGRLLYLSLWHHLLLGGRKLLLQPGGRKWHHSLQLFGISFGQDILLLVRILQTIFGEMGHLREKEGSVTPEQHRACDNLFETRSVSWLLNRRHLDLNNVHIQVIIFTASTCFQVWLSISLAHRWDALLCFLL